MAASAPAIIGEVQVQRQKSSNLATGSFYFGATSVSDRASNSSQIPRICFNASRSSSIYGASTTVRPVSRRVTFLIRY